MKKEINELLKSDSGSLRLNNICVLRRYTTNVLGESGDWLRLDFDNINHKNFGHCMVFIDARDWQGIAKECGTAIFDHMNYVSLQLANQLKGGLIEVIEDLKE